MTNNLKAIRLKNKKTQAEVAQMLGISYQAYAHYEKGRRQPAPEQLAVLADYYSVSIDELMGRSDKAPKDSDYDNTLIKIATDEEDLIYYYRRLGEIYGSDMQHAQLTIFKSLVEVTVKGKMSGY